MPDPGPETLELSVRFYRLELSVSADLGEDDHPWTPRVDGNANDTYFWMRATFDVTPALSIFLESFQGANSIVPSPACPSPRTAWDGFQIEPGLRVALPHDWKLEAGPVLYALSATGKKDQIGTRVQIGRDF
jgi:hypothetical protein